MEYKNKLEIIKSLFANVLPYIDTKLFDQMADISQESYFPKQSTILNIGERQDYIYLVISGLARSYYIDEKGNDLTKLFVKENEFLIGEALFMDESLEVFEAIENLRCLRFPAKEFKNILMSNPILGKTYIATLENTIRYKMKREYAFQCLEAKERYLEFKKDYPNLEDRIPQYLIASYLGISKETLSRIRKNI